MARVARETEAGRMLRLSFSSFTYSVPFFVILVLPCGGERRAKFCKPREAVFVPIPLRPRGHSAMPG